MPTKAHLATSGDVVTTEGGLGGTPGIQGLEARDAAEYATMHRIFLEQKIIQFKMSVVPRWREPI